MPDSASSRLPARPSLDQLRKQAKDLLRAWRDGDPSARQRGSSYKPDVSAPLLADAQYVIAREHGFDSWPKLVHHVISKWGAFYYLKHEDLAAMFLDRGMDPQPHELPSHDGPA